MWRNSHPQANGGPTGPGGPAERVPHRGAPPFLLLSARGGPWTRAGPGHRGSWPEAVRFLLISRPRFECGWLGQRGGWGGIVHLRANLVVGAPTVLFDGGAGARRRGRECGCGAGAVRRRGGGVTRGP